MKKVWWLLLIIFVLLLLVLFYNKIYEQYTDVVEKKKVPGKTIWLLWFQGWDDNTPWLVKKVRESWEFHNPDWNIELLTKENIGSYIDEKLIAYDTTQMALSDIIRLNLLATHGGVWADATMLCMRPLEDWLYDALQPCGFWMYHGKEAYAPTSWFIISMHQSTLIQKWTNKTNEYWKSGNNAEGNYFWMDSLFNKLCETDSDFLNQWRKVPYISCEDYGESHMLAGKGHGNDDYIKNILNTKPPYTLKLSRHENISENTDGGYAIMISLKTKNTKILPVEPAVSRDFGDNIMVVSDCKHEDSIIELDNLCSYYNVEMIVYDKCNFCKHVPSRVYSRPLQNKGREAGTFMYFIVKYYNILPNNIIFTAGNTKKHDRIDKLTKMIKDKNYVCETVALHTQADFLLDIYEEKPITPAEKRPFKNWYQHSIGEWDDNKHGACWNGLIKTTREKILKNPKQIYINLLNQLNVAESTETAHYVERSLKALLDM